MPRSKTFVVFTLLALLLTLLPALPSHASSGPRIFLDKTELIFDVPPVISQGRTLVPIRALATALGFVVDWDSEAQQVTLTQGTTEIKLWLDSTRVDVNGQSGTIDVPATSLSDRIFVPVRFIAETLGTVVGWDQARGGVTIASPRGLVGLARAQGALPDADLSGNLTLHVDEAGDAVHNQHQVYDLHLPFQMQSLQGELTASWTPFVWPVALREGAIMGGELYTRNATSGEWQSALAPAGAGLGAVTGLPELDLPSLPADLLANGRVTLLGTTEIDGLTAAKVRVDLTAANPQTLYRQVIETLPTPVGQEREVQVRSGSYVIDYTIDPATGFVYQAHREVKAAASGTRGGKAYRLDLAAVTDWRATPNPDPVRFPISLVAVPRTFASEAERQASLAYLQSLAEELAAADVCYGERIDGRDLWNRQAYAEINYSVKGIADCFANELQAVERLAPPRPFAEVHAQLRMALDELARAYRSLDAAVTLDHEGNHAGGDSLVDEFERLSRLGERHTANASYQLLLLEAEYGLTEMP